LRGRTLILAFAGFVALFVAALVWFQVFAYYERQHGVGALTIDGAAVPVADYDGIDATTSPLKLRGCFRIDPSAVANLAPATDATPLVGPFWFRCFDAGRLTDDLAASRAEAYRIAHDDPAGFDTLIAVYPDGEGYLWRQLNGEIE
jgi:hypothetical protein